MDVFLELLTPKAAPQPQAKEPTAIRVPAAPRRADPKDTTAMLESALALVKAAGYRVTKPKEKKKDRVGPTFVARFADGQVTRMSTFTSLEKLDWERGIRLAGYAWEARKRVLPPVFRNPMMVRTSEALEALRGVWLARQGHHIPPRIVAAYFEQDGVTLATYDAGVRLAA